MAASPDARRSIGPTRTRPFCARLSFQTRYAEPWDQAVVRCRHRVEHHAVGLDVGGADLADHALEVLERVIEAAEEVEVLRRACERRVPHVQQLMERRFVARA